MICLAIRGGHNRQPKVEKLDKNTITIGRLSSNDIVLKGNSVSSTHVRISKRDGACFVTDLKSTNGTSVDGKSIAAMADVRISSKSVIGIGSFQLQLQGDEPGLPQQVSRRSPGNGKPLSGPVGDRYYRNPEVIRFKAEVHKRLLDIIDLRRMDLTGTGDEELRKQCDKIVRGILEQLQQQFPSNTNIEEFIKDVLDEALGLGPLEDLLADEDVSEIMVNRCDQIFVERAGKIVLSPRIFSSNVSLMGVISRIVGPLGRRVDESTPMVDARLKDGSRFNAIIPPLALDGPSLTIRKFAKVPITMEKLVGFGTLTREMAEFIKMCVAYRKNIIVSGGTGSGKTTTLNVFCAFVSADERIVTIEDAAELQLPQEHVVRLETRPPNIEEKGEVDIRQLVKNALRMRPDRIIVGECRGGEALDMLQAMNTGHDGSLTTGHANSPVDMMSRLETMVMMSSEDLPSRAIREQIAAAIDIVVQQTRFPCGARIITRIAEVTGLEDGNIVLQDIFYFKEEGRSPDGKTMGSFMATGWIPDFYQDLEHRGLPVDMSIFH